MPSFCCKKPLPTEDPSSPLLLFAEPPIGIRVGVPLLVPNPGDVLLGYSLKHYKWGFSGLTTTGLVLTGALLIIAAPLALIPLLLACCHEPILHPVFGKAGPNPELDGRPIIAVHAGQVVNTEASSQKEGVEYGSV